MSTNSVPYQTSVYRDAYRGRQRMRWLLRFDVRHRVTRFREALAGLGLHHGRFLDVGFGGGDLLAALPNEAEVFGAEISTSAVARAQTDPRFARHAGATFVCIAEEEELPQGPFDAILSSHVIEHVPCDANHVAQIYRRLRPGGHLFLWAPIEEPGYNPDHVRNYSVASLRDKVAAAGFEIVGVEPSMNLNGHVWKLLTLPSRRRWPVLGPLVNGLRLASMCWIPYSWFRACDRTLDAIGIGPRQAFILARRPLPQNAP